MGIGKASVYKYIPEYFPRDVGAVGGLVGTLGALGGFVLPLGFGYLDSGDRSARSCFWVMLAPHAGASPGCTSVVAGMNRRARRDSTATNSATRPASPDQPDTLTRPTR